MMNVPLFSTPCPVMVLILLQASGLYMHLFVHQCFCDMQIVLFLIYVLILLLDQFVIKENFRHDSGIIPKFKRGKKKNYPQTWEGKSNQGGILKEIIWMSMFLYLFILFNMKHELCWYTFYVSRGQTVLCFEQRAVWEVNISYTTSHSTPPNFSFQEPLQLA